MARRRTAHEPFALDTPSAVATIGGGWGAYLRCVEGGWGLRRGVPLPSAGSNTSYRLEIRREQAPNGGVLLVVTGGDAAATTEFRDMAALVRQQSRLEQMLLDSGWSFDSFEPERRSVADRRAQTRETHNRRRWWTDPEFRNSGE